MRNNIHEPERFARFNAAVDALANETDEDAIRHLISELYRVSNAGSPERMLDLYTRARTPYAKGEFAMMVWLSFRDNHGEREKGFYVMLDYLYSRQIGNDSIRAILKKYPLLPARFTLTSAECEAVVTAMLDFLKENPATEWGDYDDYVNNLVKVRFEDTDRGCAARLLSVLYNYPATSRSAKERLRQQEDLIVTYHVSDYDHWGYSPMTLDHYLTGHT